MKFDFNYSSCSSSGSSSVIEGADTQGWGVLGKEVRVTLLSCAVCCIRAHFPLPGIEEDFTFKGFRFADE